MSITFKDHSKEVLEAIARAKQKGLEAIGLAAEGYAKKELTKLVYSRGSNDKKYRLTGRLRNSITFAISGKNANISSYKDNYGNNYSYNGNAPNDKEISVYIGSNVEYAPYVELGTSRQAEKPFLRPAATQHSDEYKRLMQDALDSELKGE